MSKSISVTDAELQVLQALWKEAPMNANQLVRRMLTDDAELSWSPGTIQTLLTRLVKKQAVTVDKSGAVFQYTPTITQDEYLLQESKGFLSKLYKGSFKLMAQKLAENEELSAQDVDELKALLDTLKQNKEE